MLIIRLILVLLAITAMVMLGLYLLLEDKKYLHYLKQTLKYTLFLVVSLAVLFLLRRMFYI
jgi:competence protein ComGF